MTTDFDDEMTPAMSGRAWRDIERKILEIIRRSRFYSQKERTQLITMASQASRWARIAEGKAGNHDHQRI